MALNTTTDSASARLVKTEGDPRHAGFKVVRQWEKIDATSADTLITTLNAKRTYASGIKADQQLYSGRFIHSSNKPEVDGEDAVYIVQEATKVDTSTDSGEARLVSVEGDPAVAGTKLTRAWYYLDPYFTDNLYTTLNAITQYTSGIKCDSQAYSGRFTVARLSLEEQADRTHTIKQFLTKTANITGNDTKGWANLPRPLIGREKELIHPFGEGTGTGYGLIYKYPNLSAGSDTKCMDFPDTFIEHKIDTRYNLVDRKTTTEDDRTVTFSLLLQWKDRRRPSQDSDYQTPDERFIYNKGRKPERKIEKLYGLDATRDTKAIARLEDTSALDTNFNSLGLEYTWDEEKGKTFQREIIKNWRDTRTDSNIENPFGREHLAIKTRVAKYRNYRVLPGGAAKQLDYALLYNRVELDERTGLFNRDSAQFKPSPSNPNGTDCAIIGWDNPTGSATLDSVSKVKHVEWDRVRSDTGHKLLNTLLTAQESKNSSTWRTQSIDFADYGDGSARIRGQFQKIQGSSPKFYVTELSARSKYQPAELVRCWPDVDSSVKKTLTTTNGAATKGFKYGGSDSYAHKSFSVKHHGGKIFSVFQTCQRNDTTDNTTYGWQPAYADTVVEAGFKTYEPGTKPSYFRRVMKLESSYSDAFAFAAASTTKGKYKEGFVKRVKTATGQDRFEAHKVIIADTWTAPP